MLNLFGDWISKKQKKKETKELKLANVCCPCLRWSSLLFYCRQENIVAEFVEPEVLLLCLNPWGNYKEPCISILGVKTNITYLSNCASKFADGLL